MVASEKGHYEVVMALIGAGAEVSQTNKVTHGQFIAHYGLYNIMRFSPQCHAILKHLTTVYSVHFCHINYVHVQCS